MYNATSLLDGLSEAYSYVTARVPAARPATIAEAIRSRRSVRAFRAMPVSQTIVSEILRLAARAPSGTNMQPWKVHVVTGSAKARLQTDLLEAFDNEAECELEYAYYPAKWREPYLGRRRKIGWGLYGLLGIGKRDLAAIRLQHRRNFIFFDAPVGLFFTMDRSLERGSWLDAGMFLQNVMIAARGYGLHTCPQAAFIAYHDVVRRHLDLPDSDILLCGMALGYEDESKPENRLRTEREPLERFVTFHDR